MKNIRELRKALSDKIKDARKLLDDVEKEKRDLNEEEVASYDALMVEIEARKAEIAREEKLQGLEGQVRTPDGDEPPSALIGMEEKDVKRYSMVRAIRAALSGDWREATLEREASEAVAKLINREPRSFFVPYDAMVEKRDLTKGTAGAGGYLVETDLASASFIDLLRNQMLVRTAGATILGGLVGDVTIPRHTAGATAYWLAESGAPTESQQTVDQVALTPKCVGAFTDYSRKLIKQSSIDVEQFVRNDLSLILALAIDRAALHGTGASNQPTGIAATSGIGSVAGGTNGLAPAWTHIVKLETEVAIDNADIGALSYMTNAKVRGKLKETQKVASSDSRMVWADERATPLNGYPGFVTNQVASDLVKGTSGAVCSAIFFGNWRDLLIGEWGTLDVLVNPYTGAAEGIVRIHVFQDVDVAVRHAESFAAMLDALTA